MEEYNFKKSTCERYDIRFGNHGGWAIITIDEKGGLFNAQSDYGNYSYSWPSHGRKSFKHFILELAKDRSYFLGKVSERNYFDFDRNLAIWKKEIINQRRNGYWTRNMSKEDARYIWDFINDIDSGMPYQLVQNEIYSNSLVSKICCGEPWYVFETITDYSPSAVCFAKEVMPIFAEILKEEINEENSKAAG